MLTRLTGSATFTRAAAWAVGFYLEWTLRSTRWTIEGADHLAPFLQGGPVIVACWHERLALAPALWLPARAANPARRIAALASRHRDGRLLAAILARFGVTTIHGSSAPSSSAPSSSAHGSSGGAGTKRQRGGASGLRALLAALAQGQAIVITPDGPRGPRRQAAPGTAHLAALSQAPLIAAAGQLRHRITLSSWDRMVLPLPFGRGALVCLEPIMVERHDIEAGHAQIASALSRAADRADVLCG